MKNKKVENLFIKYCKQCPYKKIGCSDGCEVGRFYIFIENLEKPEKLAIALLY